MPNYKGSKMHSFTGTKGYIPTRAKTVKMYCNCAKYFYKILS